MLLYVTYCGKIFTAASKMVGILWKYLWVLISMSSFRWSYRRLMKISHFWYKLEYFFIIFEIVSFAWARASDWGREEWAMQMHTEPSFFKKILNFNSFVVEFQTKRVTPSERGHRNKHPWIFSEYFSHFRSFNEYSSVLCNIK